MSGPGVTLSARLLALASLAACGRVGFDSRGDGGDSGDSAASADAPPVVALDCGTTQKLADIGYGWSLAATVAGDDIVVVWVTDMGRIGAASIHISANTAQVTALHDDLLGDAPSTRSLVSVAHNGPAILVVTNDSSSVSTARRFTSALAATTPPSATGPSIDSWHAVAPIGLIDEFAIVSSSQVLRLRANATSMTDGVDLAATVGEHRLVPAGDRVIALTTNANVCYGRVFDMVGGTSGVPTSWGTSGCTTGAAALVPMTNEVGFLRINGATNTSWKLTLGTRSLNTLTFAGEGATLWSSELQPEIAAGSGGYWITRVLGGQMFFNHISRTGAVLADTLDLDTPVTPVRGHTIVMHDDQPYALWAGGGLWIAHLCQ